MDKNAIRNILTIMIVVFLGLPVSAEVLGTYTTNEYFYLPAYGEFGEEAFDEYNLYMQKADTQIQANKEAIVDWTVDQDPLKIHANNYVDNDTTYSAGTGMQLDGNTFKCTVTDTNTTYSAGTGLSLTGTTFSSTITQYTDNLAISAIKNDNAWNASNWDTAYGWGDHSTKGYLTGITNENIESLKNVSVSSATSGQVLKYNGTNWINDTDKDTTYSAGTGMSLSGTTFDCNVVDTNTTYSAGTGMQLDGTTFNCTVVDTNTTYTAGDGLKLTGTQFSLDFKYDPSIASGEYSGIPDTGIVGEAVVFGDLLYFKWSDKKYWKARADNASTAEVVAMAVETKSANNSCVIIRQGYVKNDSWSSFEDSIVYLSTATAGKMQSSVPVSSGNQIKRVGQAIANKVIFFNPSQDIGEVK